MAITPSIYPILDELHDDTDPYLQYLFVSILTPYLGSPADAGSAAAASCTSGSGSGTLRSRALSRVPTERRTTGAAGCRSPRAFLSVTRCADAGASYICTALPLKPRPVRPAQAAPSAQRHAVLFLHQRHARPALGDRDHDEHDQRARDHLSDERASQGKPRARAVSHAGCVGDGDGKAMPGRSRTLPPAEFEQAEKAFDEVREVDPYRLEEIEIYSNMLYVMNRKAKLGKMAHEYGAIDKNRAEVCCLIGECPPHIAGHSARYSPLVLTGPGNYYSAREEHTKAIQYFKRSLQLNRDYLPAWTLMGHEYVELKNSHAAIEAYRRAIGQSGCRRGNGTALTR